jgi:Ca-activated chloride channel family protein
MDVHVANPRMLMLLWLVPVLAAWWYAGDAARERALLAFMGDAMQRKLRPPTARSRFRWQAGLVCAGLLLCLVAAARPQWGQKEEVVFKRGRDVMIVLDVSRSMLANDLHPNRLQRAKADILDLVKELRGDRAGLIAFRRRATVLCPLTTDYSYFRQALEAADPDSAPRGETDIGGAIRTALDAFESDSGAHKAIVLISDGEDLAGHGIEAARDAGTRGIPIFTVGLGSRDGSRIPDPTDTAGYATYQSAPVVTRLDNEALHAIARETGGAYIPVETAGMSTTTLGTLYRDHLRNIAAQDLEETLERRYIERYQLFLLPGLLCLLAGAALSSGRLAGSRRKSSDTPRPPLRDLSAPARPARALAALLLPFVLAPPAMSAATNAAVLAAAPTVTSTNAPVLDVKVPPGRAGGRMAQRWYQEGDYARAAEAYLRAADGATADAQRTLRYNAAVAHYHAGRFREAAEILRTLADDPESNEARVAMDTGRSLYREADAITAEEAADLKQKADLTREAADAFRRASRAAPDDPDAAHNAAVALEALQEREDVARIAELLKRYEQVDAGRLSAEMLENQRRILIGIDAAATNQWPERIRALEAVSALQRENADRWVPLKGKLLAAMPAGDDKPQAANAAALEQTIEAVRDDMREASDRLRDLDTGATQLAGSCEALVYKLWKAVAPPELLLAEDIRQQTNTLDQTTAGDAATRLDAILALQTEARSLTELFAERYAAQPAAPDGAAGDQVDPQAGVNLPAQPASTNDVRAKILDLSQQALATQSSAMSFLETKDLPEARMQQEISYRILKEIEALLPKQNQQQQQQQQEQQQQNQDQSQPQQTPDQQQPPPQQEQPKSEPQQQEQSKDAEEDQEKEPPDDVLRMLERALQREKEHEAEKRRRQRVPLSPVDRDW